MKIIDHKDAINRRLYNNQSFVETAIYRVYCLNRTGLTPVLLHHFNTRKFLQTVEEELYTRSICHYRAHHYKSLTLLSQPKINDRIVKQQIYSLVKAKNTRHNEV